MSKSISFIKPYGSFHRRYEIVYFIEKVGIVCRTFNLPCPYWKCPYPKYQRKTSTPAFDPKELIMLRARPDEK